MWIIWIPQTARVSDFCHATPIKLISSWNIISWRRNEVNRNIQNLQRKPIFKHAFNRKVSSENRSFQRAWKLYRYYYFTNSIEFFVQLKSAVWWDFDEKTSKYMDVKVKRVEYSQVSNSQVFLDLFDLIIHTRRRKNYIKRMNLPWSHFWIKLEMTQCKAIQSS